MTHVPKDLYNLIYPYIGQLVWFRAGRSYQQGHISCLFRRDGNLVAYVERGNPWTEPVILSIEELKRREP